MIIDNSTMASISSIYWSKSSFTTNREAGILIRTHSQDISSSSNSPTSTSSSSSTIDLMTEIQETFNYDFSKAYPLIVSDEWSEEDLNIITNATDLSIQLPNIQLVDGLYQTPPSSFNQYNCDETIEENKHKPKNANGDGSSDISSGDGDDDTSCLSLSVGPDVAWKGMQHSLQDTTSQLQVAVYQVCVVCVYVLLTCVFYMNIYISTLNYLACNEYHSFISLTICISMKFQ